MTMNDPSREPVIVAAARTAVGKAKRGSLATVRPDETAAVVIRELLKRAPAVVPAEIDDLILGCAFPEGEQGMNIARMVGLRAGLPDLVPAETINRFCSSGMQSIAHAAFGIMAGQLQMVIAGGTESMSMVPMTGYKFAPMPYLAENFPQAFTSMGLTAENVAAKYGVSRQDQDAFSLNSHRRAAAAVKSGRFDPEIAPVEVTIVEPGGNGHKVAKTFVFKRDEGPRAELKPGVPGKIETSVQRRGHSHCWQLIPDVRWGCWGNHHVQGEGRGAWSKTTGKVHSLCSRRRPARNHGNWPDCCDSKSPQAGWYAAKRDWADRA